MKNLGDSFADDVRHPDDEQLAAYIDQDPDEKAEAAVVERHLAQCDDCREVLALAAAASDLRGEPEGSPAPVPAVRRPRRWVVFLPVGLAAAAAVLLAVRLVAPADDVAKELGDLHEALSAERPERTRPFEGRLSGGLTYAASPPTLRGSTVRAATRMEALELEQAATDPQTPAARAALGLARALDGNLDGAIDALVQAAADDTRQAAYQSDLSVMYLARGRPAFSPNDRSDYDRALEAAERALGIDPRSPEGCFNFALALEYLSQREESREAWQTCRAGSAGSGWVDEIDRHLADIIP